MSSELNVRSGQEVFSEMTVSDFRGESLGEDVDTGGVDKSRLGLTVACRDHNHGGEYGRNDLGDISVHNAKWRKSEDLSGDLCEIGGAFNSEASVNIEDVHDDSGDINQSTELIDPYTSVCDCRYIQTSTETGFGHDISKAREQFSCECQSTRSFQLTNSGKADENKHFNAGDRFKGVKSRRNSGRRTHSKSWEVTSVDTNSSQCNTFCKALSSWILKNMAMFVCCQCLIVLVLCVGGVFMGINYSGDKSKSATLHMRPDSKEPLVNDYTSESEVDYVISDRDRADYQNLHQTRRVLLDKPFRSVSVSEFQSHLARSESVADMLKIFFDDPNLTEGQVREIMFMKSHQGLYASNGETSSRRGVMMSDLGSNSAYERIWTKLSGITEKLKRALSPAANQSRKWNAWMTNSTSWGPRTFLPSCTIVHRCRNTTSCCPKGFECVPKKENGIQIIDRYFMVLEAVPGSDRMKPASKDFIYAKSYQNHTACECVKVEFTSNCAKFCPHSFKKERPGRDCICDCRHQHRKCQKIMHGQQALDEADLVCIKEGKCIVPECYAGEFNVANGFCPQSTHRK